MSMDNKQDEPGCGDEHRPDKQSASDALADLCKLTKAPFSELSSVSKQISQITTVNIPKIDFGISLKIPLLISPTVFSKLKIQSDNIKNVMSIAIAPMAKMNQQIFTNLSVALKSLSVPRLYKNLGLERVSLNKTKKQLLLSKQRMIELAKQALKVISQGKRTFASWVRNKVKRRSNPRRTQANVRAQILFFISRKTAIKSQSKPELIQFSIRCNAPNAVAFQATA